MTKKRWLTLGALACALALPTLANAVSTRAFRLDSQEQFSEGELDGAAVHSDGRLTRSVQTEPVPLPGVPVAYASVRTADGSIYVGTGNEGLIYRVRGDKAEKFAETGSALVTSLVAVGDTLYAGTLPEGKIYAVTRDGKASELCKLDGAEHVWALAHDPKARRLYAGTGPEGKVFGVDLKGKAQELYDSDAEHVLTLALDDGTLYAGLSDGARVLRVSAKKVEVVADLDGDEVTALDARGGSVAAAAGSFPTPPPVPDNGRKGGAARLKRPKPGSGKLYRLESDGRLQLLHEEKKTHFSSVQLDGDGVLAGTGQGGRVLRVASDTTHAVWADVDERQVVSLALASEAPYFVTSDAVAVYRVVGKAEQGEWTSDVLDASFAARWGELAIRGEGDVAVATRSGNTERPDDSWSEWSEGLKKTGPVRSPAARFLQLRARLRGDATVHALTAYYLPQNQMARIHGVHVKAPKSKDKDKRPKYSPPKPTSTYKLAWSVENPDEDLIRYRLHFQREGQSEWREILREHEELRKTEYEWDTRGVPDGYYRVKVEGSDELANPGVYTLRHAAVSPPLRIDNHAPRVLDLKRKGDKLSGRAVDSLGPVAALELSIDGAPFRPIFPRDDLLDTAEEAFDVDLSKLSKGSHILSVRATDAAGNVGSAESELSIR